MHLRTHDADVLRTMSSGAQCSEAVPTLIQSLKANVSFKWIHRLSKLWRLCCQEVKVGGFLRLLMRLRCPAWRSSIAANFCTMVFNGASTCLRLTGGINGEGGGTGGQNAP
jgi:hypothetical protein